MFHFILRACRLRRRAVRGTALLLIAALLFSSCGEIPDISKFAEASAGMTGAIRKGYAQTDELLGDISSDPTFDDATRDQLKTERKRLKDSIGATFKMLDAIDDYLDALQAIAAAQKESAEQSSALFSAVDKVVEAVRGFEIPQVAIGIAEKLFALHQKFQQEKNFKKRVNLVAEIMEGEKNEQGERTSGAIFLLQKNVEDLKNIGESVCLKSIENIKRGKRNSIVIEYRNHILKNDDRVQTVLSGILEYKNLVAEFSDLETGNILNLNPNDLEQLKTDNRDLRKTRLSHLLRLDPGLAPLKTQLAQFDRTATGADVEERRIALIIGALEQREPLLLGQTKALATDMQRLNPSYNEVMARVDQVRAKQNSLDALLTKSFSALDAWAETHAKLRTTLNTKQPLTASRLIGAVTEMLEILKPEKEK